MIVEFKYGGQSGVTTGLTAGRVALATNALRDATYFHGQLGNPVLFREALAALHTVVVSDYKYHPRDRLAYKAWLDAQDQQFLAALAVGNDRDRVRLRELEARRGELDRAQAERMRPFHAARMAYFNYAYEDAYEADYLFDPVVTVHPDELSLEAFSRDESAYARVGARYDLFSAIDAFACGTTNIDFSARLHGELERLRGYRGTRFDIDAGGVGIETEGLGAHREKKIDLPETWVKGFLQVHSTMAMGLTHIQLDAMDLFNLCRFLRQRKARTSPRAMRFELVPGKRTRVVFEPWEHGIELGPRSVYDGPKAVSIRTWGRDRLLTLVRLIPVTQRVDLYLAGTGLPSVYVVDLGELTFTLALSGWAENDWTGGGSRFDLLVRRLAVAPDELTRTYEALRTVRYSTDTALATGLGLGVEKTRSALSYLCQVGRAMFDLGGKVFRHRELFLAPFTVTEAAAAVKVSGQDTTPEEKSARRIVDDGGALITARRPVTDAGGAVGYKLSGSVKDPKGGRVRPLLSVDSTGRIVEATCSCTWFRNHGMTKGPCEHILALRLAHMNRLEAEDTKGGPA